MNNIVFTEKIKSNPRRYLLVYEDVFCKQTIVPNDIDDINKEGRMSLNTIDGFTSKYGNEASLLYDFDIYDDRTPHKVYIEYNSNGEVKQIPVMYNDKRLSEIALNSTSKLWDDRKTRKLFTDMSFVLLRNDHRELEKLLNSKASVTEPHLRNLIGYALNHGTHTMNMEFMKEKLFDSYKQWRAVYYHSMYIPEQKVKKKV